MNTPILFISLLFSSLTAGGVAYYFLKSKKKHSIKNRKDFDTTLNYFASQERIDKERQAAWEIVERNDSIFSDRTHSREGTIKKEADELDESCNEKHIEGWSLAVVNVGRKEYAENSSHQYSLKQLIENVRKAKAYIKADAIKNALYNSHPNQLEANIHTIKTREEQKINQVVDKYKEEKHNIDTFKGTNNLVRSANLIDKKNSIYIALAIALLEGLLNYFFLRDLASSIMSLIIVTVSILLNVGVNGFLGYEYRIINHKDKNKASKGKKFKYISWVLTLLVSGAILSFRLWAVFQNQEDFSPIFYLETFLFFSIHYFYWIFFFS